MSENNFKKKVNRFMAHGSISHLLKTPENLDFFLELLYLESGFIIRSLPNGS